MAGVSTYLLVTCWLSLSSLQPPCFLISSHFPCALPSDWVINSEEEEAHGESGYYAVINLHGGVRLMPALWHLATTKP